jgi:hypothetical protein
MTTAIHPEATHHLPFFITPPGETDILMNVMMVFLALVVFLIGILYLRLHALPEHMAHGTQKVQYEIVAVLALISLFTHNHIYWIMGCCQRSFSFDFSTPLPRSRNLAGPSARLGRAAATGMAGPERLHAAREAKDVVMLELILCSMVTMLPDYLFRRYAQGGVDGHGKAHVHFNRRQPDDSR